MKIQSDWAREAGMAEAKRNVGTMMSIADKHEKEDEMTTSSVAAGQIKSIIERVERLEEEKSALAGDIKEI